MLGDLFFFIGLVIFLVTLIRFQNFRKNDEFAQQHLKFEDYPPERKLYLGFQILVILPYMIFGLLTDQWWLFLFWLIISPLLTRLFKRWYFGRKLHAAFGITLGLFIVLNHFHLHLTPSDLGLPINHF